MDTERINEIRAKYGLSVDLEESPIKSETYPEFVGVDIKEEIPIEQPKPKRKRTSSGRVPRSINDKDSDFSEFDDDLQDPDFFDRNHTLARADKADEDKKKPTVKSKTVKTVKKEKKIPIPKEKKQRPSKIERVSSRKHEVEILP